jgi:hypothetical protein
MPPCAAVPHDHRGDEDDEQGEEHQADEHVVRATDRFEQPERRGVASNGDVDARRRLGEHEWAGSQRLDRHLHDAGPDHECRDGVPSG